MHKDKGIKIYEEIDKEFKWSNLFNKSIKRNQYINFDDIITYSYKAINPNPEIIFYKTLKNNCISKDEKERR